MCSVSAKVNNRIEPIHGFSAWLVLSGFFLFFPHTGGAKVSISRASHCDGETSKVEKRLFGISRPSETLSQSPRSPENGSGILYPVTPSRFSGSAATRIG